MNPISVIIPTYNHGHYLTEALHSVLDQAGPECEVIIIDDGSRDHTKDRCQRLSSEYQERIRYFYQKNMGPGEARNYGIRKARAPTIAFLDADDCLLKGSISKRIQLLNKFPHVPFVFTDYHVKFHKHQCTLARLEQKGFCDYFKDVILFQSDKEVIFSQNIINKYLQFSPYPIYTGTVMFRKSIVEDVGYFRTDIKVGEDLNFFLRIVRRYQVGFINEPLSCYNNYRGCLACQFHEDQLDHILNHPVGK